MDTSRAGGPFAAPTPGMVSPTSVFRYKQRHPLNAIFEPKSIAVVGATEKAGSVGRTILWNLISNPFGGTVCKRFVGSSASASSIRQKTN